MKFKLAQMEIDNLTSAILARISDNSQENSFNGKEQIARLIELKDKIIQGNFELNNNRNELSLFTGLVSMEIWNKFADKYKKTSDFTSTDIIHLTKLEIEEIKQLETILLLFNKVNKDKKKELFLPKLVFHEKLKSNLDGIWFYSHSQGKLYKSVLQINEKEYIDIKLNNRDQILEIETFPNDFSYFSSFTNRGTKKDIQKLIENYKKENDLDNTQKFILGLIKAYG